MRGLFLNGCDNLNKERSCWLEIKWHLDNHHVKLLIPFICFMNTKEEKWWL